MKEAKRYRPPTQSQKMTIAAPALFTPGWILFFLLLIFKVMGVVSWSWWIIFAPLYVPWICVLLIALVVIGVSIAKVLRS